MGKKIAERLTNVSLRRIAIDDSLYAALAADSKTNHIPMQDLVGGAVAYCLSLNDGPWLAWHAHSRECLNRRLQQES